eukprot:s667_g2.t1
MFVRTEDLKLARLARHLKDSDVIKCKSLSSKERRREREKEARNSVGGRSAHLRAFRPDVTTEPRPPRK